MSAAQFMGLMYSYSEKDDLHEVVRKAFEEYYKRFRIKPWSESLTVAFHPGTQFPAFKFTSEVVERKFIRPGFILVGKFEKEESQDVRKMD
jgi:hypothetical protein